MLRESGLFAVPEVWSVAGVHDRDDLPWRDSLTELVVREQVAGGPNQRHLDTIDFFERDLSDEDDVV